MLRIGHCGDLHLTDGPRFEDTMRCLDFIIEDGTKASVQLWAVSGDLTGTTVPHLSTLRERNALDVLFMRMAETAPVFIVCGNHDQPADLEGYGRLKGRRPIIVANQPTMRELDQAVVCCMPYPFRSLYGDLNGTIAEQYAEVAELLRGTLDEWASRPTSNKPLVLLAHLNIAGSMVGGDEILAGQEIELTRPDLDGFPADYIALGHIHVAQQVAQRAWYSGSPSAQDFGATDPKGYLIVDVEAGKAPVVHRRFTPARRLVTVDVTWDGQTLHVPEGADLTGAEVRVRVEIPEEHAATCPSESLEEQMKAAGATTVKVVPKLIPTIRVRSEAIAHARTTEERVIAYWDSLGSGGPGPEQRVRCLAKLAELEQGGLS